MENSIIKNCKRCSKEFETSKYTPYVEYCPECTKIVKNEKATQRRRERVEILKQQRLEERNYESYICQWCGNPFIEDFRIDLKAILKEEPRFCCKECLTKYSSNCLDRTQTKQIECTICHELKEAPMNASLEEFVCNECKEKQKKEEKRNNENSVLHIPYRYSKDCVLGRFERSQAYSQKSSNLQKLGFNFEDLNWEEEFFKIRNMLYDLYYVQKYSLPMIREKFGFIIDKTPKDYLKLFGFNKFRNVSEGVKLSFKEGRVSLSEVNKNYNFIHGWYKLKNGNEFYYRSSYELEAIKFLENKNIDFTLNTFHTSYISSEDNEEHEAFPDFYLPKYNLVIEMKNYKNFKEKDLQERYLFIKNLGYDFIVITCKGYYLYDGKKRYKKNPEIKEFRLKEFKVLKSFIEDKEKEKQILDLLEIKNSEN